MITDEEAGAVAFPTTYGDEGRLHDLLRSLRARAPVTLCAPEGYAPFWAVAKYDDVTEVSRRADIFVSRKQNILFDRKTEERIRAEAARRGAKYLVRSVVAMDDPEHAAYRQITQSWFMPARLRSLLPRMSELAARTVDEMIARGTSCDFVNDVAVWYPLRVIMLILGVDETHKDHMLRLTQQLFAPNDPDMKRQRGGVFAALEESRAFFAALTQERRDHPRDDVASVIANARIGGELIGELEAFSYYNVIATAGHDTTSSTAAAGFLALCQNPEQLRLLAREPERIPLAVEEFIRWASPVRHFLRTAVAPYELRGQRIEPGDRLMLLYPSANRDEDVFIDPFRFDVERQPNRHLGFGHGPHSCLGMNLARFELAALFRELIARTKEWRLDAPPTWVESSFVGGPKRLDVSYLRCECFACVRIRKAFAN